MATRKEEEKNERIIRSLLKLPENRRCVNCNSLGPQYVCTNFWTFVCTTCGGIHREFTHRVKSVSMAKFTSQEVAALQGAGNQRARELYFKEWDAQHHTIPDSGNVDRLRDFIKHVYVDRRYTGERTLDKPPRAKMGDKEDLYENRRTDSSRSGSRSPYEDSYDRRYSEKSSPGSNLRDSYDGRRSPGYDQETPQYGDNKKSPVHSEIVNDWRRDDRFGNGRRYEDQKNNVGDTKLEGSSPGHQKDPSMSSPPIVRPVRDILGDNVSPLRIIEPPKANTGRSTAGLTQTQRTASSSSVGSTNGNVVEPKIESLIDFDADPSPPVNTAASQQAQQTAVAPTVSEPTPSSSNENWASFDLAPEIKASQAPPAPVNTLESVISQLSAPASVPGHVTGISYGGVAPNTAATSNMSFSAGGGVSSAAALGYKAVTTFTGGTPAVASANNFSAFPSSGTPVAAPASASAVLPSGDAGQWSIMQQQQQQHRTLFPAAGNQPPAQQHVPSVGGAFSNQSWNSSLPSSTQGVQTSHAAPKLAQEANSVVASQPLPVEANSGGRKALPEDLFSFNYSSIPVQTPGWQTGVARGMGFNMQYTAVTPQQLSRSSNPFDLSTGPLQAQASAFPSLGPLQGALPTMPPPRGTGLVPNPNLVSPPVSWMPNPSSPYTSALPPQAPSYTSAVPPGPYIGQQVHSTMSTARQHGFGDYNGGAPSFGPINSTPQLGGSYSAAATLNPLSSAGGNPFA